jgi:phage recombination protein Bet
MALVDAVWPSAKTTEGIELALAYCRARRLDPFKRPVHIVPVWNSKLGREVESVWPGIGELRTTAARTGQHAGYDEATFGPDETRTFNGVVGKGQYAKEVEKSVTFPLWAQVTVYRVLGGQRVAFPGPKVWWLETYATMGASDVPNEMWETRPRGQLEKCAEAAALRRAFPEEVGSEYIPEEIGRQQRGGPVIETVTLAPSESRADALAQRLLAQKTSPSDAPAAPAAAPPEDDRGSAERTEPSPGILDRGALVDEIRSLTSKREDKADLFQRHFAAGGWLAVTKLAPGDLANGLDSLKRELAGLAELKRDREPGEED